MDTLRTSLEILFKEMMVGPLLKEMVRLLQHHFDHERFVRLFQARFQDLSIDQCRLSFQMVSKFYMQPPNGTSVSTRDSVFNVLLHFNREVLREYGGIPVCKFEHLLRWSSLASLLGEDLLTTSFLACEDIQYSKKRCKFDWGLVIEQDDPDLRELFSRKMADVHMHLKGSSSNFDLNWLCLMNHPHKREKEFRSLSSLQHPLYIMNPANNSELSLYALAVKACAIRYLLYSRYVSRQASTCLSLLNQTIYADDIMTKMQANSLDSIVHGELMRTNRSGTMLNHDYAWQVDAQSVKTNPNSILCGERNLLYKCFVECYSGKMTECGSHLLYAYILIKNHIRNELIQSNGVVGFDNFNSYEVRKTLFIENYPVYIGLVEPLAIGQYFYQGKERYVEPRITPKNTAKKIHESINELDKKLSRLTLMNFDNLHYVLHFIKRQDSKPAKSSPLHPRHHELRNDIQCQATAIGKFRKSSVLSNRIVGIDAANSEIFARPEVFAQAFRFLRDTQMLHTGIPAASMGMTYHVGEDFLSVIDGLRAIDEVLHYLRFRRGDRLGHALVLGVDPVQYLQTRRNTLLLPKILVLDDIAWCLNKSAGNAVIQTYLENIFYRVFREVFGGGQSATPRDYYESWLLRGDNPVRYERFHSNGIDYSNKLSHWSRFDFNDDSDAIAARNNHIACRLYYNYHFNPLVRKNGEDIMKLHCPDGIAQLISDMQHQILQQLELMNIGIETNPTSNIRIGGFNRYLDLPVMRFLSTGDNQSRLSASVNTDDRGVFATSIEREYALLACALSKGDINAQLSKSRLRMSDICDWLDRIRLNGLTQRFINNQ